MTTQHHTSRGPSIERDQFATTSGGPFESAAIDTASAAHLGNGVLPEKLTLTVSEAAKLLGISRAFAYELVAREVLRSVRLGRRILVPTRRLLRLVQENAPQESS